MAERTHEPALGPAILAEDLLLLLFQPESPARDMGVVVGESTLSDVLAGAVLADLGLGQQVRILPGGGGSTRVEAVAHRPPADDILRSAWDYLAAGPKGLQAAVAAIGPALRGALLDRLVERGDIRRSSRTVLGLVPVEVLEDGGTGRRDGLLSGVRSVLVDGVESQPRLAALAALLSGSGTLPQFGPGIPWTASVIARAMKIEQESGGAEAAAEAIARTIASAIDSAGMVAATAVPTRQSHGPSGSAG
ncbi:GOLPH3/VPS74 family protein [Paractinoplanes hotanensis]|uniref:GPP34 family phosphoprotein n=1 Tax=Paractinoplanes hotanensis TaxID=2906497 RepID=A0ABT0XWJ2_9ACTN|nr:GPP34 family phosphoprotein [Actinoplanes hotanensis]MCM4078156.1 GPP34 family phosphoprotein [Actinoplanes hotanensis]